MLPHEFVEETSISLSAAVPEPPERREGQRHLTILRVGALTIEGVRELCLVRNISAGGVMAHVYRQIDIGTRVEVDLGNDQVLPGRIAWETQSNVGIAFDDKIDVAELLAQSRVLGDGRRARRPRVQIDRMAKVRCGSEILHLQAEDISQGGTKLACDQPLPIDADVVVTLDGMRALAGIVRWSRGGYVGISFLQVIPIAELCEWLRSEG